jgi:hypothetical protein
MGVIRYSDFDLEIDSDQEHGGFRTTVLKAPAGEKSTARLPELDEDALEGLASHVADARDVVAVNPQPVEIDIDAVKAVGGDLYRALFAEDVGEALRDSLWKVTSGARGLRIRLRVAPALARVPWEYVYHERLDRFLCLSVETPVVRYLDTGEAPRVVSVEPPLRVLVMISDPTDYPALDADGEFARLMEAMSQQMKLGRITLERLGDPTMQALLDRLRGGGVHVFHFIGHGAFEADQQDGLLVLKGSDGKGVLAPGDDLGTALHDHRSLRLAVLNTCEGARGSVRNPFGGTAQGLIQQRVPAVVAMQYKISDVAAKVISEQLYASIVRGFPVDAALGEARKTLFLSGNRLEWATPVLFMRSPNGRIFSIRDAPSVEVQVAEVDPLAPEGGEVADPAVILTQDAAVHVDSEPGALLTPAPASRPAPKERRPPIDLRPKDFPGLLGREAEVRTVTSAFLSDGGTSTEPVEITGRAGAGKTAVVRNVAHHPSAQFPNGVVYTASEQGPQDFLRFLFQTFYETDVAIMPMEAELRAGLHEIHALVEIDDVTYSRDELEMLTNVAPNCLFVLSSERSVLLEQGPTVAVRGLPQEAALRLLEQRLDRSLTPDEVPTARLLIEAVGGLPLPLVQAAARVRLDGISLEGAMDEARAAAVQVSLPVPPAPLSEAERRVASVLAAVSAPVDAGVLALATGLPEAKEVAEALKERGLVESHSPRYSLAETVPPNVLAELDLDAWGERALEALAAWVEEPPRRANRILEQADAVAAILRWGEEREKWPAVIRLGRAVERTFAVAARWERWAEILGRIRRAATALEDRAQEGWSLHQLGTRAVALDQIDEGKELLFDALRIRRSIRDRAGVKATTHNLRFIGAPIPPPPLRGLLRWLLPSIIVAAVVVGAIALFGGGGDELETGTASLSFSPDRVRFSDQEVGSESAPETVTITSTGDQAVKIKAVHIEPDERDFEIESSPCEGANLATQEPCTVTVLFHPTRDDVRHAVLVVGNSTDDGPLRIRLSGTGTPPAGPSGPTAAARPTIELDPDQPLEFIDRGQDRTLSIHNGGKADLSVSLSLEPPEGISIDQAELLKQFAADLDSCSMIKPNDTCPVTFRFAGNPDLPTSATLVIDNNATDQPIRVPLTGVPNVSVRLGTFAFDPAESRWEAEATVMNIGTAPFEVFDATTTDPEVFSIVDNGCVGAQVGIDGSCTITIVASAPCPQEVWTATLQVSDSTVAGIHSAELRYVQDCSVE